MSPVVITADLTYVRLHGPAEQKYQGSYGPESLSAWADHIRKWRGSLTGVYFYFDNDQAGFAVRNALDLRNFLS